MIYLLIVIISIINSMCQIFLKIGSKENRKYILIKMFNIYTLIGYGGFFVVTILTVYLLKHIPFKSITLILSLNFLFTLFFSWLILKERITKNKLISTAIIVTGVIIYNL